MDSRLDIEAALAALAWQVDLGADEPIGDLPVNRYEEAPQVAAPPPAAAVAPVGQPQRPVQIAEAAAAGAGSLPALKTALGAFEGCEIKRGARNLVFADGTPGAHVMVLGEAPGRDEDVEGRPFAGQAGAMLDRMFAAIGLARDAADPACALYLATVLPWRPPQDREPTEDEIALMRPFVERHVALASPRVIVAMGNAPLSLLLNTRGITRLRGGWAEALGRPVLPMCHPAYVLRNPETKRDAWADLLSLQARLRSLT
jgi:uracil-DNA glycosylase